MVVVETEITMAAKDVVLAPGVDRFIGTTPIEAPVVPVDDIIDLPTDGIILQVPGEPAERPARTFEWKPLYWGYVAIGAIVLYILLKK